jgi:peptidoglycan/xylan/chitin deacetylase (PgdA/CDA1 family)
VVAPAAGVLVGLMLAGQAMAGSEPGHAGECPGNPDALGTSRTLVVDPTEHPKLGSMQYHESLPLEDHEIVLTFDDGPLPPRTTQVLETLDHECVKATFFLIGKMAIAHPEWVKRIHDAGHTIGTHSNSHPLTFHRMPLEKAQLEINQGIANVTAALGDGTSPAPFFRIPGLLRSDVVERYAASQNIQVWSADFVADDWTKIGPGQVYSRALQRIEAAHKGILLLHDIQVKTVEALPNLLRELKRRGYKIVQVVPATQDRPKTVTDPSQWMIHAHQASRTPVFFETEPELPAPNPASFGFDIGSHSLSYFQKISLSRDPAWQPLTLPDPSLAVPGPVSTWPSGFEVTRDTSNNLASQFNLAAAAVHSDGARSLGSARSIIHAVGETTGVIAVSEIQRLLESLPEESVPENGPPANAVMPRGAFP